MKLKTFALLVVVGLLLTFGAATSVSAWYATWCRDTNYPTTSARFCCADGASGAACNVDSNGCYVTLGTANYGSNCYNAFGIGGRFLSDATNGARCGSCPKGGSTNAAASATSGSCWCSAS